MELENNSGKPQKHIKPVSKIEASSEEGFDLSNCFKQQKQAAKAGQVGYVKEADYYYDSYSHFNIHEEMLKDVMRTETYRDSIIKNRHLFEGKVVLDVGCGTGILSIFAARAGAKQVIGVDAASIAEVTKKIIKENNLDDKITIIKGKIEEVQLPVEKVDIIISEWMGYFLLYESMLDCVLWARDHYLVEDGLLFPDRAIMYLSTIEDEKYYDEMFNFWDDVYGVDMSCIKPWVRREPLVEYVEAEQVNGSIVPILDIDLKTVQIKDLDFSNKYQIQMRRNQRVHGFVSWFETLFSHGDEVLTLSTSPQKTNTHWKQTIFYLEKPFDANFGDVLQGSIAVKKAEDNERNIDVKISCRLENNHQKVDAINQYKLN